MVVMWSSKFLFWDFFFPAKKSDMSLGGWCPAILNSSGSRVQGRPYREYLNTHKTNNISRSPWPGTTLTLVSDRTHVLRFIFPKLLNPVLVAGVRPLNHIHVWWQRPLGSSLHIPITNLCSLEPGGHSRRLQNNPSPLLSVPYIQYCLLEPTHIMNILIRLTLIHVIFNHAIPFSISKW